jgi:hypothetical protein
MYWSFRIALRSAGNVSIEPLQLWRMQLYSYDIGQQMVDVFAACSTDNSNDTECNSNFVNESF